MRKILVADLSPQNTLVARTVTVGESATHMLPKKKILVAACTLCSGSVAKVLFDVIQGTPDYHFLIWIASGQEQLSIATARRCLDDLRPDWPDNFHFLRSNYQVDKLAVDIKFTFLNLYTDDTWYMPFSMENDIPIVTFSHSVSYFEDYPFVSNPRSPKVVWQRKAYLLATKIICWSKLEKTFISRFLPIVSHKIEIVPLCQRTPEGTNSRPTLPVGRKLKVLFAGRPLAKRKGFEFLATALRELAAKGHEVELTVADAFTDSTELAKIRFSDLLDSITVRWLHDLSGDEMRRAYQSVHVVIVPSLYDSWCKVVTEAIAEGTPVIATDATGSMEYFPCDEVVRVKAGDCRAIVDAVEHLISDYPSHLAATRKARERLRTEFTLQKHAARLRQAIGLD